MLHSPTDFARRAVARSMPGTTRPVGLFLLYSTLLSVGAIGISDAILNFYFVSLGHGPETIGLFQSMPRVAGFLSSIPIGLAGNRVGARRLLLAATYGLAFSYALLIVWPSEAGLAFSRFVFGLSYGIVGVLSAPVLMALTPARFQTHVFAYLNVTTMGATAVASVIAGFLPLLAVHLFPGAVEGASGLPEQTPFAYRFGLLAVGVTVLLGLAPLFRLHELAGTVAPRRRSGEPPARTPWLALTGLSLPLLIFGFTGGLTFPFYNLFFRQTFDVPDRLVGIILSFGWLGMALVPLADPWWERRWGRAGALGVTMSVAGAAFFGLSLAPTLALGVICYVVAISFRNVMQPLFQPLMMDTLPPGLHNVASSVGILLWNTGWFSATAISGIWQERYGFGMIMQVVALGALLNALSVVAIFRRRPRYQPALDVAPPALSETPT